MLTILGELNISPNDKRQKVLLPYAVATDHVRRAPTHVKKELVFTRKCHKITATKVGKAIKLSRKLVYRSRVYQKQRTVAARADKLHIVDYLKQGDNSVVLPGKRDNVRGQGLFGLVDTMENLYTKFCIEFPEYKLSRSTFFAARPAYIKLVAYTRRRQCVCQRHADVALKMQVAKVLPRSAMALCAMSDDEIRKKLCTMPSSMTVIRYLNWKAQEISIENRVIKKTKLTRVEEKRSDFIDNLVGGMSVFREHCRRVVVQYQQLKHLQSRMMPKFEVTVQLDYAENWAVKYQDEIAAVYFDKNQITIHPMIVHYKVMGTECDELCHKSFVGVSSVTAHSVPTTFAFISALMSRLKALLPELKVVHFISDSPSSQYRNRSMCSLVARFPSVFNGIEASWSWLESGHGKGPCDGIGGGIKKKADNLVKSGKVITNTDEFCATIASAKPKLEILRVEAKEVNHCKQVINTWKPPAVPGIGAAHTIVPVGPVMMIRDTSCFEDCCYEEGGVFHPRCYGWQATTLHVHQQIIDSLEDLNEDAIEEPVIEEPTLEEHVIEQTLFQQDTWLAVRYGKGWYIAKVLRVKEEEGMYEVTYMSRVKGEKWKFGPKETGMVDHDKIIRKMAEPQIKGKIHTFPAKDILAVKQLTSKNTS